MRKRLLIVCVAFLMAGVQQVSAQMSDSQIISYITEAVSMGKSESQIGNELLAKGVSVSQIKRLVKQYKSDSASMAGGHTSQADKKKTAAPSDRTRTSTAGVESSMDNPMMYKSKKVNSLRDDSEDEMEDDELSQLGDKKSFSDKLSAKDSLAKVVRIYGHDVFRNPRLSFEPNENAATPENYVLGPGDQIIIDIYGMNEASLTQTITPEGVINITQVGPINLNGLTIKQATAKIKKSLSKIYSSIADSGNDISVTLGKIRTIQVNILGEVRVPGTYRLSSFTSLFNALYRAGGITKVGSLRNVKVVRGGKQIASADIYQYLFDGKAAANVSLKEGDAIIVPPYESIVEIKGGVKRPMKYEMKDGETVSALLAYAGGFTGEANRDDLLVSRKDGAMDKAYTVSKGDFATFKLQDCDEIVVSCNEAGVFANQVEVKGAVYRPGKFQLGGPILTVGQLISQAGGCLEDAYLGRAQIVREKADRTLEMVSVPLKGILEGNVQDIMLKKNDLLVIASVKDIKETETVSISGFVREPGEYEYAEHTTVNDLIMLAGGFITGASKARVEVSRRILNPNSTSSSDTLATVFTFPIQEGLMDHNDASFELQPYDVVAVRKSPTYVEQKIVSVTGEVTYPGQYTLVSGTERISDLIKRAGGATVRGSLHGGMLRRQLDQYERNMRQSLGILVKQKSGKDTLDVQKLKISEIYPVGVEIDKAIQHPGSEYDLILRDGDEIIIPAKPSTVRVEGEVLFPNTVQYIPGKPVRYYINQAGGFNIRARRSQVYVLKLNGTVAVGMGSVVEPGCEIIVPNKPEGKNLTTGEWLGIGTSAASIATMVATIVNLFKK